MTIRTTAQRLADARALAAKIKAERPRWVALHDWRQLVERPFQRGYSGARRSVDGRRLYASSFDALGWRYVGDAHNIAQNVVRHCGWFADQYYDALIIGAVLQLPARRGVPQYVAATYCTTWDGVTVYLDCCSDRPEDCAYLADQCAEREAQEIREAEAKDQAERDIAAAREVIHEMNKHALALIREIRAADAVCSPGIRKVLRERLNDYLDERRRQFEIIEQRRENYWTAVEDY